ncbi:hypothetical protein HK104_005338 [Borealophlyctis nickersoniae]|nr:hypothetical protein HK104_005338 [Borealophlyctis nickersoniae]
MILKTLSRAVILSFVTYLLAALGGGMLAAFLTGRPSPILSNLTIPVYTLGYLVVFRVPYIFTILRSLSPVTEPPLIMIDAMARATGMAAIIDSFRGQQNASYAAHESHVGQFILGTLGVTAGGIMITWIKGIRRFAYPGWDFTVVMLSTLIYASSGNERLRAWGAEQVKPLMPYAKVIGVPRTFALEDWKVLCTLVMIVGFALKPGAPVRRTVGYGNARTAVGGNTLPRTPTKEDKDK